MRRALRLARRGLGRVEPNPMVGCVLVRDEQIIGEGWHRRCGGAHAEVDALRRARESGADVAGCDVFVTLEPCSHHGKTPPCVDALIEARVGRVVAAMADPSPHAAGAGFDRLRDAGVAVEVGVCEAEARELNHAFIKRVGTGLPWVIAKWAQTIDGRIATRTGKSKWISNERSRRYVHQVRARVDAVMVGVGTVLADDPLLTARDVAVRRVARRVVVDPTLRLPVRCALVQSLSDNDQAGGLTIAVSDDVHRDRPDKLVELERQSVELVPIGAGGETVMPIEPLLGHLSSVHEATNVLVEGGATLISSLIEQGLVDELLVFIGPKLLGDAQAVAALAGLSVAELSDVEPWALRGARRFGDDVMLNYRRTNPC